MQQILLSTRRCIILGLLAALWGIVQFAECGTERQRDRQTENPRLEQLRQEAQQSASEVKDMLDEILSQVNLNQRPDRRRIESAATLLEDNKRHLLAYDDEQKAAYMLLQAWTDFYRGGLDDAMNWALRACKTDMTSGDAWISQSLFCMLNGKRPPEPRIRPEPRNVADNGRRPRPQRKPEREDDDRFASASEPYGRKGTLSFDLSALRPEMLKERFSRMKSQPMGTGAVEYVPGEDTLCAFFWQVEPTAADSNDLGGAGTERGFNNHGRDDLMGRANHANQQAGPVEQGRYFKSIYELTKGHPQVTCLALNTNSVRDAEKAARGVDDAFAAEVMGTPQAFAADAGSGAAEFVNVDAQKPFLVIADKEGIVRYAGPGAGFMPAFVVTHLTGTALAVTASGEIEMPKAAVDTAAPNAGGHRRMESELMDRRESRPARRPEQVQPGPQRKPVRLSVDPNVPGDPNHVRLPASQPKTKNTPAAAIPMTAQDQVKADKLLALAEMEIEACRTIRGKSPAKGVDACKQILEQYPGTDYAEKAREQLRRVPQRYWDKYGIEDLLGY